MEVIIPAKLYCLIATPILTADTQIYQRNTFFGTKWFNKVA
jgi:hypothetical protein